MNKLIISILSLFLFSISFGQKTENLIEYKKEDYQRIISDINIHYFNNHFQSKYKNDSLFYKEELSMDTNLKVLDNFNVILESILADPAQTKEDRLLAKKALDYNKVYAKYHQLMTSQKDFYNQKFETNNANEFIAALNSLEIDEFDGLQSTRKKELEKINTFKTESCKLKSILDPLKDKAKTDNDVLKSIYLKIEKKYQFPYLKTVVRNMSNNLSSYTADSLEDNCAVAEKEQSTKAEEAANNEKDTPTAVEEESQEVVKENTNEASKEETINEVKEDKNKKKNSKKGKVKEEGEDKKDNTNPSQERENGLTID